MRIKKMLYKCRFIFPALGMMAVFVFFVQLAMLDSLQTVGPMVRSLRDQVFNQSISQGNQLSNQIEDDTVLSNTLEYVDWNDYGFMAKDAQRQGWGEQGTAFNKTLTPDEQALSEKLFQQYRFNAFASDHISLERSIGDTRTGVCKTKKFLKNLPHNSVSIVIIFYNEKNSTVLRSLHSFINKSPARLLREIVVVDDFSSNQELQEPLEKYVHLHFHKVRIIRNHQRQGLIRSRMIGANATSGDILLFMDAHTEVNHNYLPPLIEPIVFDYRKIVCPVMDTLQADSMKIRQTGNRERGAFSWDMVYRRLPVFQEDETVPHPVPTMVGAAMAISRKWWVEIGMYDPGLEIWGGEQYEISFKSWQCGGSVVDAPCSRVAHLFRPLPYVKEVVEDNRVDRNFLRVARVWMDEYIEYVFQRKPVMRKIDPENLTEQYDLRKRLNCKPFKWYLAEIAPDILKYFPPIEPPNKAWGKLRSNYNKSLCVLTENKDFYLRNCDGSQNGYYVYNWRQHIDLGKSCFANPGGKDIFTFDCLHHEKKPTQGFVWDLQSGRIVNLATHLCIDVNINSMKVYTTLCDNSKSTQSWTFENFNATLVQEAWTKYKNELGL